MTGDVDRMTARLALVLVGIMTLEAALFRQIIPVAVAAVLAGWEAARPGDGPAGMLVRVVGRPPVAVVSATEERVGNAALAVLGAVAVALQAGGLHAASWVVAAVTGGIAVAAAVAGRPTFGIVGGRTS
jgi:hypothetical protein